MPIDSAYHMPAVSLKAFGGVVGEPSLDVTIDRDAVIVVERHQLTELQRPGQGANFMRNALHHATVAHKGICEVIDNVVARAVKLRRESFLGDSHADRIGYPLPQRPGGGFDARGVTHFRVPRRFRMQLTEVFSSSIGKS